MGRRGSAGEKVGRRGVACSGSGAAAAAPRHLPKHSSLSSCTSPPLVTPTGGLPNIVDSKQDESCAHGMKMQHMPTQSHLSPSLVTPTGGFHQHCRQQTRRGLFSRHANAGYTHSLLLLHLSPCHPHRWPFPTLWTAKKTRPTFTACKCSVSLLCTQSSLSSCTSPPWSPPQVAFPNIVDSKEDEAYAHGMQMRRLPTFQRIAEAQGQALLREGQGQVTIGRAEDQEGEPSPHGGAWDASGDRDLGGGSVGADSLARSGSGQGSRSGPAGSRTATDDASGSRGRFLNWISNVFAEDADPGRAGPSGSGGGGGVEGAKGKGVVRKSCR